MSKKITEAPEELGKKRKVKFQYKSLEDPKYLKDKKEFLKENGNGWWIKEPYKKKGRPRL
jgi:hypothetical protein